ncbi:hypothetical protein TRICI_003162 [Trichomonascus ciferrii]|uniref:AB hydrolase-1 domain-containing protein n=1 Tax=Trichomonascus ciferrii TaxID=44093 RepID=A0A642V4Q4_9ASCO|nr:hypothetical protein TRICI_003162 [Trichomonascus ciferrii]
MSLLSLLSCSVRSFVDTAHGEKTVKLPLKEGDGGHISLDRLIAEKVPQLKEGSWFWQSPLLGNGHLQTIYGTMAANDHIDRVYYGRRLVTWDDDGSTVSVDYVIDPPKSRAAWDEALKYCPIPDPPPYPVRTRYLTEDEIADLRTKEDKPLAIVLHGMSGGSHESYVRAMVSTLSSEKYGLDCMVLNSRGCARTRITTPQLFCGISTDDVRRLVRLVHKEQPNRRIYLIGFSLGAAIAANYLGQEGEDTAVTAAALLACPWDFPSHTPRSRPTPTPSWPPPPSVDTSAGSTPATTGGGIQQSSQTTSQPSTITSPPTGPNSKQTSNLGKDSLTAIDSSSINLIYIDFVYPQEFTHQTTLIG